MHEAKCFEFLDDLRRRWRPLELRSGLQKEDQAAMRLVSGHRLRLTVDGQDGASLKLDADGLVAEGWNPQACYWRVEGDELVFSGQLWLADMPLAKARSRLLGRAKLDEFKATRAVGCQLNDFGGGLAAIFKRQASPNDRRHFPVLQRT